MRVRLLFVARERLSYALRESLPANRESRRTGTGHCHPVGSGAQGVSRMLPDLRFVIGAVMATALLGVTLFGLAAAMHISHQSKVGPLEASRLLAYAPENRHRIFDMPARRLDNPFANIPAEANPVPLQQPAEPIEPPAPPMQTAAAAAPAAQPDSPPQPAASDADTVDERAVVDPPLPPDGDDTGSGRRSRTGSSRRHAGRTGAGARRCIRATGRNATGSALACRRAGDRAGRRCPAGRQHPGDDRRRRNAQRAARQRSAVGRGSARKPAQAKRKRAARKAAKAKRPPVRRAAVQPQPLRPTRSPPPVTR